MTKLNRIKQEITRLDKSLKPGDHAYETYLIMLSALVVGPNVKAIAKFAKLPRKNIAERARRLRKNGVWVGGKVACEWLEKDGGVAFIADALVADGLLERA